MDTSTLTPEMIQWLINQPAAAPPPGITAESTLKFGLIPENLFVCILAITISTVAILVRSYTKAFLLRKWNIEDSLLIVAWLLLLVYSAEAMTVVQKGGTRHIWNTKVKDLLETFQHINVCGIVYGIGIALIKIAILLQYLRIFVPHHIGNMILYYIILITIGLVAVFYTIIAFFTIFLCNPRSKISDPMLPGTCWNWASISQASAAFNVISDFAVFLIPIFPLWGLQMSKKRKAGIIALFATGFLDCIASIMRMYYTWLLFSVLDTPINTTYMGIWIWIEMAFAILVACLPVAPKFFRAVFQRIRDIVSSLHQRVTSNSDGSEGAQIRRVSGQPFSQKKDSLSVEKCKHADLDAEKLSGVQVSPMVIARSAFFGIADSSSKVSSTKSNEGTLPSSDQTEVKQEV